MIGQRRQLLLTSLLLACEAGGDPAVTAGGSAGSGASAGGTAASGSGATATSAGGTGASGSDATATGAGPGGGSGPLPCQAEPMSFECATSPGILATAQVQAFMAERPLVLLDVRSAAAFDAGHLPGAVRIDPGALRATVDGVPGQVAAPDDVRAVFEAVGLTPMDDVVVYDVGNTTAAARTVWTLAYHGHGGGVWALDGGYDRWVQDGLPTSTEPASPTPSSYPVTLVPQLRVDKAWMLDRLGDPMVVRYDARSSGEYDAGHIPDSRSVEWTTLLDDQGMFLPPLEAHVDPLAVPSPDHTLVTYCQTGSRASVDWLVLAAAGHGDVRIYDGSWAEWGADPNTPKEP